MEESTKATISVVANICFFCLFVFLVILGHREVGYKNLAIEILGLSGILVQLWLYNRKYK